MASHIRHEDPTLRRRTPNATSVVDPLILVADDDQDYRSIFIDSLERQGYSTIERPDGLQAVEAAQEYRPDVVLMDVVMPRLDGLQATRLLKADATTAGSYLVIVTGSDAFAQATQAGCDAFLSKPFDPVVFDDILEGLKLRERDEIVKRCACGRELTRAMWRALPLCGWMEGAELRNCSCCSTLGLSRQDLTSTVGPDHA
jgi:two-component system cell cycle response regulator DivK